jgi:hypothetical protein
MNKSIFLLFGLAVAMSGCVLRAEPELRATETANDILVPGRFDIMPLSVPVIPQSTGRIIIHVFGYATDIDVSSNVLAIELGRDIAPGNFDIVKYVQLEPGQNTYFDVSFNYQLPLGFQFNETVSLGSNVENQSKVNVMTIDVEEY